jgi:large subunit ribosomal protein L18
MPSKKIIRRFKIKQRISNKVKGTSEKPRLNVFRSNSEIYVQVIDDSQSNTLVSASSFSLKLC